MADWEESKLNKLREQRDKAKDDLKKAEERAEIREEITKLRTDIKKAKYGDLGEKAGKIKDGVKGTISFIASTGKEILNLFPEQPKKKDNESPFTSKSDMFSSSQPKKDKRISPLTEKATMFR